MNFLAETIWVMCTYGAWHLAWGLAISSMIVIWASRRMRLSLRMTLLVAATLALWIAMFIAADSGYRAWQGIPNPPDEAFSDTGPIFFLSAASKISRQGRSLASAAGRNTGIIFRTCALW